MSKDLNPDKALIFRIVHKDNLAGIMADGCRCRSDAVAAARYVDIGNLELIERRRQRLVPCGPGGTLSDYVPFYFTPFTPMMYNIKTGFGVPKRPVADIVILVSSLHHLREKGLPFVFTDRHAYLKAAQFSDDLADLSRIIWGTLQARDFRKDDVDKFEKYQAEALVHRHVPLNGLLGMACRDDAAVEFAQSEAAKHGAKVRIVKQPGWYL